MASTLSRGRKTSWLNFYQIAWSRIEPMASCLPCEHSANCATVLSCLVNSPLSAEDERSQVIYRTSGPLVYPLWYWTAEVVPFRRNHYARKTRRCTCFFLEWGVGFDCIHSYHCLSFKSKFLLQVESSFDFPEEVMLRYNILWLWTW